MSIEKTVSEIAEILGVSRQAVNNRVKQLPEEDLEKNAKGVTVVKRCGLIKLEEIYKKTILDDEPIDEETKQRELLEILVDENGSVKGMTCIRMELGEPDDSGRRRPVEIAGSEFTLDVDTVIMSLGTSPNPLISSTTKGLETTAENVSLQRKRTARLQKKVYLPEEMPLPVLLQLSLQWEPVKQVRRVLMNI